MTKLMVIILSTAMAVGGFATPSLGDVGSPFENDTQIREARMAWWRDARFGMFVHWGLYSGLAGTWKGEPVGDHGGMEWIQQRVKADTWEYAHEGIPHFRPAEGFAEDWAQLARDAGCKYVVFTSKHHEGFALHDSSVTDYDAHDLVGRDLCREIVDAVRSKGLRVGFYHSVIDWHHPQYDYDAASNLPHPLHGQTSPNGPRNHAIYIDYLHHQVRELMSNYGTIDIMWWDFSQPGNEGPFWRANELMAMVRGLQPAIITNDRLYALPPNIKRDDSVNRLRKWGPERGDFTTPEQVVPSTGVPGVDWEVCMTMNTTWGYSEHDRAWKSTETLLRTLIDIVSKGGNYLLNIGPKGDGSIPEESITSMRAIGDWMKINGEAIYCTTASPFEPPSWGRYTAKPGKLYVHVFDWPTDGTLTLPLGGMNVKQTYLLSDASKSPLNVEKASDTIKINVPAKAPDSIASVIVVDYVE